MAWAQSECPVFVGTYIAFLVLSNFPSRLHEFDEFGANHAAGGGYDEHFGATALHLTQPTQLDRTWLVQANEFTELNLTPWI